MQNLTILRFREELSNHRKVKKRVNRNRKVGILLSNGMCYLCNQQLHSDTQLTKQMDKVSAIYIKHK